MMKQYSEEMFEVMIRHAGREVLAEIGCGCDCSVAVSDEFNKKMHAMIGRQAGRRRARKALKVLCRVAAIVAVFIAVSTAVIFSSDALRAEVMNMIITIRGDGVNINYYSGNEELPEGIVLPKYTPEGFEMIETTELNGHYVSRYENGAGDIITIDQLSGGGSSDTTDPEYTYQTKIAGRSAVVLDCPSEKKIIFYDNSYLFTISGNTTDISELLMMAESMLE
jgi:hypothetical protein